MDPLPARTAAERRAIRPPPFRGRDDAAAEQPISSSIFGLARHAATAAVYLGLAYAAKLAFGVSLTFNAMR